MLIKEIQDGDHKSRLNILIGLTLFICLLSYFLIVYHKQCFPKTLDYFVSPLTDEMKKESIDLLREFLKILNDNNIEHFIFFGTLLGSARHHGLIPWDDDIDVTVTKNASSKLVSLINKPRSDYVLYTGNDLLSHYGQWKFYRRNASISFPHRPFKYPYIDIWFYEANTTHLLFNSEIKNAPQDKIYPLVLRPFEDMLIPSPCNFSYFVQHIIDSNICKTRQFSHLFELPITNLFQRDAQCKTLYHKYPFVFPRKQYIQQKQHNQTVLYYYEEILKKGSLIISNITIPQYKCSRLS